MGDAQQSLKYTCVALSMKIMHLRFVQQFRRNLDQQIPSIACLVKHVMLQTGRVVFCKVESELSRGLAFQMRKRQLQSWSTPIFSITLTGNLQVWMILTSA